MRNRRCRKFLWQTILWFYLTGKDNWQATPILGMGMTAIVPSPGVLPSVTTCPAFVVYGLRAPTE